MRTEIEEMFAGKAGAEAGAKGAYYVMIRLNGAVGDIFRDWLEREFPDRANKVWHQIQSLHGGNVNDNRFGTRMRGEGLMAKQTKALFQAAVRKAGLKPERPLSTEHFRRPQGPQLELFE